MCLISCSAKFIGDLTLWGRNHLLYWETVGRKTAHRGTRAAGCGGGASQISQVFSQQLRRQPRAPLGSDLFDEKELRPEPLRPHRCRLLGFGPPQVWSADVRHLRGATAVSSRFCRCSNDQLTCLRASTSVLLLAMRQGQEPVRKR